MTLLALQDQVWFKFLYEQFGWKWDISDTLIEIGNFSVKWYGLLIAVGFLLALIYAFRRASDFGINTDKMVDVVLVATLLGFVGARLYYVVFSDRAAEYFANPLTILEVWKGGLGIYGGIIFGLGFGVLMCKLKKVNPRAMLDMASLGFLIGQAVGRWGNFFNQEAFGSNTDLPWGMSGTVIQSGINGSGYNAAGYVHPTFLYESLWNLLGFALINLLIYPRKKFNGQVAMTYFAWYGFGRMLIEGLRTDSLYLGNSNIRVSQLVAALCFVVFTALIVINLDRARKLARQEAGDTYVPVFTPHTEAASDENALCAAEQQTDAEQEKTDDSAESPTNNE
jgi:phosphatidylglycerol:prolipoprotein diacylglycerol transferase